MTSHFCLAFLCVYERFCYFSLISMSDSEFFSGGVAGFDFLNPPSQLEQLGQGRGYSGPCSRHAQGSRQGVWRITAHERVQQLPQRRQLPPSHAHVSVIPRRAQSVPPALLPATSCAPSLRTCGAEAKSDHARQHVGRSPSARDRARARPASRVSTGRHSCGMARALDRVGA